MHDGSADKKGKVDRRVLKTRAAIEDALARLIVDTDYDKITVSALAKEADVNRKTFYLHYSSVDDVLDAMAENHAQKALSILNESGVFDKTPLDIDELAHVIGESYRQARLFNPMLAHKFPTEHLISTMQPHLERLIEKERTARNLPPLRNAEYYVKFMLGGMFATYESWYNSGDDVPFETIAHVVAASIAKGLDGLLAAE